MSTDEAGLADYPEFLSAMLVKELRQGVRGRGFVVPFVAIHVLMLAAFGLDMNHHPGRGHGGVLWLRYLLPGGLAIGETRAFWWVASVVLIGIMPLSVLNSLSAERQGRNLELLQLTGLSRWRIVLGKWSTHCALASLTAVTMLPYLLVRYFLGGMDLLLTLAIAVILLALNATANALAVGLSGYKHVVIRVLVGLVMAASFYLSVLIAVLSAAYLAGLVFESSLLVMAGSLLAILASCLLFCALGLQLARVQLRLFVPPLARDLPIEGSSPAGLVWLIIGAPIILLMTAALTLGTLVVPGVILFAKGVLAMDPDIWARRAASARRWPNRSELD